VYEMRSVILSSNTKQGMDRESYFAHIFCPLNTVFGKVAFVWCLLSAAS